MNGRLLFFCVCIILWGLDTHGTFAGSGDEPHYAMIAHSLAFDGDVDLANDYADPHTLVGGGTLSPDLHALPGKDGRLRPVHDIGLPLLFTPYFRIAYIAADASARWIPPAAMARARLTPALVLRHLLSLGMIVISGALAVLLFDIFRTVMDDNAPAFWWALLCAASPPILSHAYLFFTEIPSAALVAACYLGLQRNALQTRGRAALLGAAVGFLLLLHIRNIGLVAATVMLVLIRWRRARVEVDRVIAFLVPMVAFIALRTVVNWTFWGDVLTTPIAAPAPVTGLGAVLSETAVRVLGLLFDQEHGLLLYAPIYLLLLPGIVTLWRTRRAEAADASVLAAAYIIPVLLPFVNPHGWSGGWSPAARFLVPIVPLLAVFVYSYAASLRQLPRVVVCLIALQIGLDALFWSHPKLLWNDGTGHSAIADFLSRSVNVSRWLPSWHHPSPYTVGLSVMALALWAIGSYAAASEARRGDATAARLTARPTPRL